MARKLPRLERVLDAPALFSIAYGEIASSIYFALGIIAFHALGFTPGVLLLTGALFLLVSLSYAEGTAAIRETGGAATFVRIAFNDFWGFVTGWALFLDYLIVIALSALYVPHYAAAALFTTVKKPWDVVAGCGVIAGIAAFRLLRNRRIFRFALVIALVDLATQLLLVILGLALLFSPHALSKGTSLGTNPSWHSIAFALPLAMLAYTGLETVANLSEEVRRPGRLAYSLGEHGQLPRVFGRLSRRSVIAPQSIIAAALIAIALLVTTSAALTHPVFFLASLYSFGVLLAFTAAQLAVIKLRFSHPAKRRPYRVPLNVGRVPVPAVVGAFLTAVVWILALATHAGARYGGPIWLAAGLLMYVVLRRSRGERLTERVVSADEHLDLTEAQYSSILVPLKLSPIGEDMVATAA